MTSLTDRAPVDPAGRCTYAIGDTMLRATGTGHCRRCDADVRTVEPWPHWRRARFAFIGTLAALGIASPILSADYCVMIPSLMLFLGAIGPLNGFVAEKPTCGRCGAVVGP